MAIKVGMKILVVNHAPYSVFVGHNTDPVKFVELTVIEEHKEVPGEFSGKKDYIGHIAKGSDGFLYSRNFPRAGEGWGGPCWCRYMADGEFKKLTEEQKTAVVKDYHWLDVTDYQCPSEPTFVKDHPYLKFCEKHQHVFNIGEEPMHEDGKPAPEGPAPCWRCQFDMKPCEVHMDMEKHRWVGWYDGQKIETGNGVEDLKPQVVDTSALANLAAAINAKRN